MQVLKALVESLAPVGSAPQAMTALAYVQVPQTGAAPVPLEIKHCPVVPNGKLPICDPLVFVQSTIFPTTVVGPGPTIEVEAEKAAGGCGEPLRFPQRVLAGKTPVHCAHTSVGAKNIVVARRSFFMGKYYSTGGGLSLVRECSRHSSR